MGNLGEKAKLFSPIDIFFTEVNSKIGSLTKLAEEILSNEVELKQLKLNNLSDARMLNAVKSQFLSLFQYKCCLIYSCTKCRI